MPWLYQRKGTDNWWLGYRVNGKQVLESTGTSDKEKAEKILARMESAAQATRAGTLTEEYIRTLTGKTAVEQDAPLRATFKQWLDECKTGLSRVTVERYENVTSDFEKYVKATDEAPKLGEVQKETIARFIRGKRSDTSAATAKLYRRILAAFFNWCIDNDALKDSPMPSAKSLKLNGESDKVRRAFTLSELKNLHDKAPNDFWRYMILAGFFLGQRMGDLICLPWGAVDFQQNIVRLRASKTGKTVEIPLRIELATLLSNLKRKAGNPKVSDSIFPEQCARYSKRGSGTFSNEFYDEVLLPCGLVKARTHKKAVKADDEKDNGGRRVNDVSFHCLRHSFVSFLKMTGAHQSVAKELAGHSTDAISDLYSHMDLETRTKAIEGLPRLMN